MLKDLGFGRELSASVPDGCKYLSLFEGAVLCIVFAQTAIL